LTVQSERGYLIPAVNTDQTDYVACAIKLAKSIKRWHPDAKICLLSDRDYSEHEIFDYTKILPFGSSRNKQSDDWQVFRASPFRQTIKLEADMYAASPIDHWWTLLEKRDLVVSLGARDFYDQRTDCRLYRKTFDKNHLPDVYNAITYWRLSQTAREFFEYVRFVFEHWDQIKRGLRTPDDEPTTDVVYAVVASIMGVENVTLPLGYGPTIVHMKKGIIPIVGEDWTKELIWECVDNGLRINTIDQYGLVHYHIKNWSYE
jgi:hypothetical protein